MKPYKLLAILLAVALLLTGCSTQKETTDSAAVPVKDNMFTDRDLEIGYDELNAITVSLDGDTAHCEADTVQTDGSAVTLTEDGTYILTGNLTGSVVLDMDKTAKPHIVLQNAVIQSENTAALYIKQADKVVITLDADSENTLAAVGEFTGDDNVDGAVFSKDDLTVNGTGSLSVSADAGHGIVCKDDLVIAGGKYTIVSAKHGIDANDSVRLTGADLTIEAEKDGIHVENEDDIEKGFVYAASGTLQITAQGDGISASGDVDLAAADLTITAGGGSENAQTHAQNNFGGKGGNRGDFDPSQMGEKPDRGQWNRDDDFSRPDRKDSDFSGEGRPQRPEGEMPPMPEEEIPSMPDGDIPEQPSETTASAKGIKTDGALRIGGGTITIDTADDALHSTTDVTVTGGTLTLSSGDDGIHADQTLTVTDGKVTIPKSYEGLEALTLDLQGGDITLTAQDDGLNAAGGKDTGGMGGFSPDQFGGRGQKGNGNGALKISGGNILIHASGDGIDANGSVEITGGNITVVTPVTGDTSPFDYDTKASITGGTFIATGTANMAQTFSDSEQGVVTYRMTNKEAGTTLTLSDNNGTEILSATPDLPYGYIILSSPDLVKGSTYTITVGDVTETVTAA